MRCTLLFLSSLDEKVIETVYNYSTVPLRGDRVTIHGTRYCVQVVAHEISNQNLETKIYVMPC